jgi:hypothetical protein
MESDVCRVTLRHTARDTRHALSSTFERRLVLWPPAEPARLERVPDQDQRRCPWDGVIDR